MFIINITYKVPLEEVDRHLGAHISFLDQQYQAGHFLASGRKVPRDGGIILAKGQDREAISQILNQDPFKIYDLADYDLIEFVPSKVVEPLKSLSLT